MNQQVKNQQFPNENVQTETLDSTQENKNPKVTLPIKRKVVFQVTKLPEEKKDSTAFEAQKKENNEERTTLPNSSVNHHHQQRQNFHNNNNKKSNRHHQQRNDCRNGSSQKYSIVREEEQNDDNICDESSWTPFPVNQSPLEMAPAIMGVLSYGRSTYALGLQRGIAALERIINDLSSKEESTEFVQRELAVLRKAILPPTE